MSIEHMIIAGMIAKGTQTQVAQEYACLIGDAEFGHQPPWAEINAAIIARWPKGLVRVKTMAWKLREAR